MLKQTFQQNIQPNTKKVHNSKKYGVTLNDGICTAI